MKKIIPSTILLFLGMMYFAQAQSSLKNLVHLTQEEYKTQIETCADSAYQELGYSDPESIYDEVTYEWIIGTINKVIDKNFSGKITHSSTGSGDITYSVIYYREKKSLSFGLNFFYKKKEIGETYILYGLMTEDSVQGIIKIFSCKKDIKKILNEIIE